MLRQCLTSLLYSIVVFSLFTNCEHQSERKIKLASKETLQTAGVQTAASVIKVSLEEQRKIAILYFENGTGNVSLDWLRRGLTDMLVADLGQSPYLNVITVKQLNDIAQRFGKSTDDLVDFSLASEVAREANVEIILTGRFYQKANSLRIEVELYNVRTGQGLRRETVEGPGLERIFSMVDELSERVRNNLRGDLETTPERGIKLTKMTQSLEAFRCYSQALENNDKFLPTEADSFLRIAIEYDSTFAAAYLRQALIKFGIGDAKAGAHAVRQARRFADKLSEPDRLLLRLIEAELTGDVEQAVATMQELLQFEPNDIETRMQLANLLLKQRDYNRALEEYELILDLDPKQKLVYNQLGYVHAYRGDFTTALKYLEEYAQLAPDEPNPYDSKGEILMMAGRLEEAAKELKTALSKRSTFYYSAMRLSEIYSELGNLKQALEYSDKWIAEAPSPKAKTDALVRRAVLLWRFGKIREAEKALNLAMKTSPTLVWPVFVSGEMYKAIGDTLAAKQLYRRYFDRHKQAVANHQWENYEIQGFLGFCVETQIPPGQVIKVIEQLSKVKNQSGRLDPYLGIRVISHLRMGEHEKVMTYFGEQAEVLLDLLTKIPNEGWSSQWKYWVEAIHRTPKQVTPDYTFCDPFLEAARKAGRRDLEVIARFLRAQYHEKYGLKVELKSEYRELGSPIEDAWRVIGPFENRSGFDRRFPPEETVDLNGIYTGASGEIRWQPANDGAYDGYVDLRTVLKRSSWAVGYGVVYVNSPEKRLVQLRVASDESCKLWLNDELVWKSYRKGDAPLDNDIITVMLRPGDNKLLLKVTNSIGDWGFYFRVTDEEGNGFPDLKFHAPGQKETEIASL